MDPQQYIINYNLLCQEVPTSLQTHTTGRNCFSFSGMKCKVGSPLERAEGPWHFALLMPLSMSVASVMVQGLGKESAAL